MAKVSGPEIRITAMAPAPDGVARATMVSWVSMGQKYEFLKVWHYSSALEWLYGIMSVRKLDVRPLR